MAFKKIIFGKESEDKVQEAIVNYLAYRGALYYHVPNGGYRTAREAKKFSKLGVRAGVPDLVICEPKGIWHGMYLELKTTKGRLSVTQSFWLKCLGDRGYYAVVAYGMDEAIRLIDQYLDC